MRNTIHIHPNDNVCVALHDLHAGDAAENLVLDRDIPKGHKIALRTIHEGEHIIKYGQIIGRATAEIQAGEHVHSHNMRTNLEGILEYHYNPVPQNDVHCESPYKLTGFRRKNGTVGIRNELWVIVTVGCINSLAKRIVRNFRDSHDLSDIDGIFTTHPDDPNAELINEVAPGRDLSEYIQPEKSAFGRGGMHSKYTTASKVSQSGIRVIIANGERENILIDLIERKDETPHTEFTPCN